MWTKQNLVLPKKKYVFTRNRFVTRAIKHCVLQK